MKMAPRNTLLIDIDSCIRCHACEIACRGEHDLSAEASSCWCKVVTVGPRRIEGKLHMDFVPILCFHCDNPACLAFCPREAIAKIDDGLVSIDEEVCNGCKLCVYGCPYGCISFNEEKVAAGHCDLCKDRTQAGLEPACVKHCIGGALRFVDREELEERISGRHALFLGRVCYASSKWRLQDLF